MTSPEFTDDEGCIPKAGKTVTSNSKLTIILMNCLFIVIPQVEVLLYYPLINLSISDPLFKFYPVNEDMDAHKIRGSVSSYFMVSNVVVPCGRTRIRASFPFRVNACCNASFGFVAYLNSKNFSICVLSMELTQIT